MAAASLAARSVASRSVHVKIFPRPRSVSESREILRALERYGEVCMFRNLKYESSNPAPNSAVAIYKDASAAERAMRASPLRFSYGQTNAIKEMGTVEQEVVEQEVAPEISGDRPTQEEIDAIFGGEGQTPSQSDVEPGEDISGSFDAAWDKMVATRTPSANLRASDAVEPLQCDSEEESTPTTGSQNSSDSHQVSLLITPSYMNHQLSIARQPYYGSYRRNSNTVMAEDLLKRLPLGLIGMTSLDYRIGEPPLRLRKKDAEERQKRWRERREMMFGKPI